jgi:hypothetical protein
MEEGPISESSSTPRPVSEEDWIIHAVNIHGIFFERSCRKIIDDTDPWRVFSSNVPVEFPPPTDHSRGKESNLDIWAATRLASGYDGGVRILSLLVECKKNNPEFVKWVFFPKHAGRRARRPPEAEQVAIRGVGLWHDPQSQKGFIVLPRVTRMYLEEQLPRADEAREARGSYRDFKNAGAKTKTANTAVTEAAYQVALATQAIFLSEATYLIKKLEAAEPSPNAPPRSLPWVRQLFFPVIVTSAQLFTCDFSPDAIDPVSGEIPFSKAAITERRQLIFEYPLPRHLQAMPLLPEQEKERGDLDLFNRMHIWVVQSGYFSEFLKSMAAHANNFFDF